MCGGITITRKEGLDHHNEESGFQNEGNVHVCLCCFADVCACVMCV